MKVTFNNIGAVKNVSIDLNKKLNVFCGPNNTGKTYIAYAIYGLLKNKSLSAKNIIKQEQVEELINKTSTKIQLKKSDFIEHRTTLKTHFEQDIPSIFGLSESDAKKIFKEASVDFDILQEKSDEVAIEIDRTIELTGFGMKVKFEKKKTDDFLHLKLLEIGEQSNELGPIRLLLSYSLYNIIAKYPILGTHILPVERNSIYTFSKELSLKRDELFEQIQNFANNKDVSNPFDWLQRRTTRYPMAIRDGLRIADDLENFRKTEGKYAHFANQIENEILDGVISTDKSGDVIFTSNKAKTKKLPIHLSASVVKTLSNLTFYLRHLAEKNDLIIIDEPELNLHPDNQVILTRIFAKLINNGFRLLISTHSDYIIRELNNLIMLSEKHPTIQKVAQEYGYKDNEAISPNDVDAHLFSYTSKTKVGVKKLEVTDAGFEIETINEVINNLNQRSEELYYYLKEGESEYSE